MLSVLRFECIFHVIRQAFAIGFPVRIIEKDISLLSFATAVYMDEDCPAVGVILTVFLIKGIYLVATLLKALHLVQRNRIAHASLTFAVWQVRVVTDTVFGILDDDMDFRPFLH